MHRDTCNSRAFKHEFSKTKSCIFEHNIFEHKTRNMHVYVRAHLYLSMFMHVYMRPLLEAKFSQLYQNGDDSRFLRWLSNPDTKLDYIEVQKVDADLFDLLSGHILVKNVKKRSSLPDILQHRFFSGTPLAKKTWYIDPLQISAGSRAPISCQQVRILAINSKDVVIDPNEALEEDQVAAFMNEGNLDEDDEMNIHNDAISEISPSPNGARGRAFFRLFSCRCN